MSNFSVQPDYLTTSSDIGIIAQEVSSVLPESTMSDLSYNIDNTITLTNSSDHYNITYTGTGASYNTVTIGSAGGAVGSTYTLGNVDLSASTFQWKLPAEWVDSFPEWSKVEDMCKHYPSLEIALRNFKTVYQLVKDDYDNPTPKK